MFMDYVYTIGKLFVCCSTRFLKTNSCQNVATLAQISSKYYNQRRTQDFNNGIHRPSACLGTSGLKWNKRDWRVN
jgi:hypothetical protein